MPFYEYFCNECKKGFKTYHGIDERIEVCESCNSNQLAKIFSSVNVVVNPSKSGAKVEKFIEESRQVLKEQLAEARKDYIP